MQFEGGHTGIGKGSRGKTGSGEETISLTEAEWMPQLRAFLCACVPACQTSSAGCGKGGVLFLLKVLMVRGRGRGAYDSYTLRSTVYLDKLPIHSEQPPSLPRHFGSRQLL